MAGQRKADGKAAGFDAGAFAGLMTGIGSSVADVFYACVGVFGIAIISNFLLKYQSLICMVGCLMVVAIGIQTIRRTKGSRQPSPDSPRSGMSDQTEQMKGIMSCFLSSFVIALTNPATVLSFMVVFSMYRTGKARNFHTGNTRGTIF